MILFWSTLSQLQNKTKLERTEHSSSTPLTPSQTWLTFKGTSTFSNRTEFKLKLNPTQIRPYVSPDKKGFSLVPKSSFMTSTSIGVWDLTCQNLLVEKVIKIIEARATKVDRAEQILLSMQLKKRNISSNLVNTKWQAWNTGSIYKQWQSN